MDYANPFSVPAVPSMQKGLAFKTIEGNIITLRPALLITREEMDRALDILDTAIGEVEKGEPY